jgi:hypothetical protein
MRQKRYKRYKSLARQNPWPSWFISEQKAKHGLEKNVALEVNLSRCTTMLRSTGIASRP